MKPITPITHGYLDYVTVAAFLSAPKLLGFEGLPALLSWTLAGVHLALTIATDFPLGGFRWLPFWIHGWIERIVGPALVLVAFVPNFSGGGIWFLHAYGACDHSRGLVDRLFWRDEISA